MLLGKCPCPTPVSVYGLKKGGKGLEVADRECRHVSQGFSVQFLEQLTSIPTTMDLNELTSMCNAWDSYYPANAPFLQDDSGI